MQVFKNLLLLSLVVLFGCTPAPRDSSILLVGTIAGPETELVEVAEGVAQSQFGLKVQTVEFEDYVLPNVALVDGSIDVNVFQHKPYLDNYLKSHGGDLVIVGETFVYPVGVYSSRIKSMGDLPQGARVAIPNDPSNGARALLLLQKAGVITLKSKDNFDYSLADILYNSKQIDFIELDAAQLPRALPDVDAAIINTNYSLLAGLVPSRDAIFLEDANSPYANVIVTLASKAKDPKIVHFVEAMHSHAVTEKAQILFSHQAIPAW